MRAGRGEARVHEPAGSTIAVVGAPGWEPSRALLAGAGRYDAIFATVTTESNWISLYQPGAGCGSRPTCDSTWIDIESVRGCWDTLERLGRIRRQDVLEPGPRSAFMMALFEQVEGIRQDTRGELYLVLSPPTRRHNGRQRLRVHDDERLRRPRERDVERT